MKISPVTVPLTSHYHFWLALPIVQHRATPVPNRSPTVLEVTVGDVIDQRSIFKVTRKCFRTKIGSCTFHGQLSMDNDCPRTIVHLLTGLSFHGQLSIKFNIFNFSWTIRKFHGKFENFMDNSKISWTISEISWTIRKFHGQFRKFMPIPIKQSKHLLNPKFPVSVMVSGWLR
jgi:hypothetical protein